MSSDKQLSVKIDLSSWCLSGENKAALASSENLSLDAIVTVAVSLKGGSTDIVDVKLQRALLINSARSSVRLIGRAATVEHEAQAPRADGPFSGVFEALRGWRKKK